MLCLRPERKALGGAWEGGDQARKDAGAVGISYLGALLAWLRRYIEF